MSIRFLSLFAGIGGFDLGLERAGWRCVGQCEIEPFCNAVLEKHWPGIWRYSDVKTLTGKLIFDNCGRIDALVGGPPCQPASLAGKRLGSTDDRWLWPDFLRLVSEVNPMWVLAENPRGVLSIEVEGVQFSEWLAREFAARGYGLLPVELAAEDVGAPHRRERVWFVGYAAGARLAGDARREQAWQIRDEARRQEFTGSASGGDVADAAIITQRESDDEASAFAWEETRQSFGGRGNGRGVGQADTDVAGSQEHSRERGDDGAQFTSLVRSGWPARPGEPQCPWEEPRVVAAQSALGGSANGLPKRLARHRVAALKALGNAVVPACAEVIGRTILNKSFVTTAPRARGGKGE